MTWPIGLAIEHEAKEMKPTDRSYHLLGAILILLGEMLLSACRGTTPSVSPSVTPAIEGVVMETPSKVRRELALVWAGPSKPGVVISVPKLDDSEWHDLPAGGWVFTDNEGEGWVEISDCMLIYVFQYSRLVKAACPKSDYIGGNVTCALEGSSVFNNVCAAQTIIQTPSAELALEGTWLSVTYLPGWQLTLTVVFQGRVKARPVQNMDTYTLGEAVEVVGGHFWFSTPGVTADPIAGITAREPHPFDQLLPVVAELNLWHWIERIKARADADNVPYPAIPPFVPEPIPTPPLETVTFTPPPTPIPPPPTPTATPCGPPANWVVYAVQVDDTLYSLAAKTGTTVEQVKQANCLVGDALFVGQLLYLPFVPVSTPTATPCGPPANWVIYVVQANDTLFSLAAKTGTTVEQVKRANCLVGDALFIGQRLYLPFVPVPTLTPTFTPTPTPSLPDLVVATVQTTDPATINPQGGIDVPIRVVVRNQGGAAAGIFKVSTEYTGPRGTSVACLTVPGQHDTCFPYTSAPLAAGSEVTFAGTISFGSELSGQTVSLMARADSCRGDELMLDRCRVEESNEGNNDSTPISVSLPTQPIQPDLAVYGFRGPTTARPGQDIGGQIYLAFINQGEVEARNFSIRLVISTDMTIDTSDQPIGAETYVPVTAPGELVIVNLDRQVIPTGWRSGNYYIGVILDPLNNQPESIENNNTGFFPISVLPPLACVDFEDLKLGTRFQVGEKFSDSGVTITVKPFFWSDGTRTDQGSALVGNTGAAGGSGNEMGVQNVNLDFKLDGPLTGLSLLFGEYGGNLNIEINGDFRNFDNFTDINGLTIGGVNVSVVSGLIRNAGGLKFTGTINSFAIGGQELWIDNVCP